MSDRFSRLTNLVALLLNARVPLSQDDIAAHVGYEGKRQFHRDMEELEAEGFVVTRTKLPGRGGVLGYQIRPEDYYLPDLGLTDEEAEALNLAVAAVRIGEGWSADAGRKLGAPGGPAPVLAALPAQDAVGDLFDAVCRRAPVTFGWRGGSREVEPYGLLFRNSFWYLVGLDRASGEQRSFRVDRFEGPVTTGPAGAFERPDGFDPSAAFPSDPKLLGVDERIEATVRVDAVLAPKVRDELGDEAVAETCDDGSVVVRLAVSNRAAFRSWVLGMLDHAEVLAPDDLRDELLAWLRAVAAGAPS